MDTVYEIVCDTVSIQQGFKQQVRTDGNWYDANAVRSIVSNIVNPKMGSQNAFVSLYHEGQLVKTFKYNNHPKEVADDVAKFWESIRSK
jgi:hypothetical protein